MRGFGITAFQTSDRADAGEKAEATAGLSLAWRVFLLNAAVFVAGAAALVLSPATVSSPPTATEITVLLAGLAAILLVNLYLIRHAFVPLARLAAAMRGVDLLRPKQRLSLSGPPEVRALVRVFNEMLDRLESERRESARRALAAQEAERKRVARELHDEIGQALTALMLQLERLAHDVPPALREDVAAAQEGARASLEDVRSVASQLRPEALDDLGLASALVALTRRFSQQTGVHVERRIAPDLPPLPGEAELVLYRVAQESLTNVARHAAASRVDLRLAQFDGGVELIVGDDGRGIDGSPVEGDGLRGMRERAVLLGGALSVTQRVGQGLEIRVEVPVHGGA